MTTKMGRYRYWGDQKPDTSRPLLTVTRPSEAVATAAHAGAIEQPSLTGTVRIYGPIDSWGGYWGVSAKEVAQALDLLGGADQIVVRVNSPGGESSEGRAIVSLLRAHKAEIITVVDGAAYSAASYIAACGDQSVMSPGTTLMIHDTSTIVYGNAEEMRKAADVLDVLSNSGSELYAEIAGGSVEEWRERQRAETWYSAASAVEAGLIQRVDNVPDTGPAETAGDNDPEVVDPSDVQDRARASYDLSLFERAPEALTQTPERSPRAGNRKESTMSFNDDLRTRLGVAEDADEATILAALDEALDERADEVPQSTASTPTVPEGMALVEQTVLDELRAAGEEGRAARRQQLEDHRDRTIAAAIESGRIAPARREHYEAAWAADAEGTEQLLASLAPGLVPVAELGHSGDVETKESAYDDSALSAFADTFGIPKEDLQ